MCASGLRSGMLRPAIQPPMPGFSTVYPPSASTYVAVEGVNCWRRPLARRAAMLVDGAESFNAFASAMVRARRSIYIAGWDIHSRADLMCGRSVPELPRELGAFLSAVVARRRGLCA